MVLSHDLDSGQLLVLVDTYYPNVWMRQDYLRWFFEYALLKHAPVRIMVGDDMFELFTEKIIQYKKVGEVTREVTDWRKFGEGRVRVSIVEGPNKP